MKLPRSMVVYWVNPLTNEVCKGPLSAALYREIGAREFYTRIDEAVNAHLDKRASEDAKLRSQIANRTHEQKGTN